MLLVVCGLLFTTSNNIAAQDHVAELAEANELTKRVLDLRDAGHFDEALPLAERALAIREKALGPEHEEVAAAVSKLASLYDGKGDYAHAEPLYRRVTVILEKELGAEHPYLASALTNLASIYDKGRDYKRAEPLFQRALAIRLKALGAEHPLVVVSLNDLAFLYVSQRDFVRAEPLFQRALAIQEKTLGAGHPDVAQSLNNLAGLNRDKGNPARAEQLYRRVLAIREKAFGAEHPAVGATLNNLAELFLMKGDLEHAEPMFQRALAIREKAFGAEDPGVSIPLNNLAGLYDAKGDYTRAAALYQRALAIREKAFGAEHPDVVASLNNLAGFYTGRGDYGRAEPLYQRALAIQEKAYGSEHPAVAVALNILALADIHLADYARAEPLLQRALAIREKAFGTEHPDVAQSLNNFGLLYFSKGDYVRAEPFDRRALAIYEKALGAEDPLVANSLNNLAGLFEAQGDYVRAEPLFQRALAIRLKTLGAERREVAESFNNLALLYYHKGDFLHAEPLFKRALEIMEKALGAEHPDVASALNNLASLHLDRKDYARAEPLFQRALEIRQQAFGAEHPDVAISLNNLAWLYDEQGDYVRAETLYRRALVIWEKTLGAEHPNVAVSLNNLAFLNADKGDGVQAEALFQRALAIREKALGAEHPDVAVSLGNLAAHYEARGDLARALQFQERAEVIREHNLNLILSTGSEGQKQIYLNTLSADTSGLVSLNARSALDIQQAAQLALTAILRRKGRALDAMTDQINSLRQRAAPEDQQLLDQLVAAQSQLAKLRLSEGGANDSSTPEQRLALDAQLTTEIENLQAAISRRSAEFRVQTQPVTLEAVQQAVPADAALVEIFSYRPFNPKATKRAEQYDPPRYIAYVLKPKGDITFVDLGATETIDRAADQFLDAISNPATTDAKDAGRALDELVARPLRKLLGEVRNVLISPDGKLNLVPFAALVDEQGKFLVESYNITYLTSGRDLLRLNVSRQSRQTPVVIANPAFNAALTDASPATNISATSGTATRATANKKANVAVNRAALKQTPNPPASVSRGRRSGNMLKGNWSELRGTAEEADYLKGLFANARVLTGKEATESALKRVVAPRILHIATHGFFLLEQPRDINDRTSNAQVKIVGENPLLRSGLVLAGANNLQGGAGEDGVLTALEAAGLNLWGTQLVVLSACETGVGDVRSGEGVYGLRRALVLAGTETQVMTLWKVDDTATSEVVIEYYRRLQAGEGRAAALRQVQLEFLKRRTRAHPFFWAGFILNGDWRSMKEKN
jgi:CHAT domain-containing protein/Tfp pilus assembly protein PilF